MTADLRKLMECYRRESADSADPEMAALQRAVSEDPAVRGEFEAIQAWDAAIGRAMHEVPVPAGLADRLVAALQQGTQERDELGEEPVAPAGSSHRSVGRGVWFRRAAAVVTSAAALLALTFFLSGLRDNLTAALVDQSAREWLDSLDPEAWQQTQPPSGRWPRREQVQFPMVGWQEFQALGDSRAVAYLGSVPPAQSEAYLLVIRTRRGRDLPESPPYDPNSTTGGLCVGVWKSDDGLCVLMVRGDQHTYRRLLNLQSIAGLLPAASVRNL